MALSRTPLTVNSSIDQIQHQIGLQQQQQHQQPAQISQHIPAANVLSQLQTEPLATGQTLDTSQMLSTDQVQAVLNLSQAQDGFTGIPTIVVYNNQAYHQITNAQTGETLLQPIIHQTVVATETPAEVIPTEPLPLTLDKPEGSIIGTIKKVTPVLLATRPEMKSGKVFIDLIEHGANTKGVNRYTLNIKSKLSRKLFKTYECTLCQQVSYVVL